MNGVDNKNPSETGKLERGYLKYVNPIQKLIEIAESDEASIDQRINCYKEIAKYTYPRLKLQELWVSPVENLAPTVIKLVAGTGTNT